ncbi:MAG TPA: TRAP transporter large permease subunit [Streptosporangiaceae bacterium]|jgi:tripartite ATP-independent transporter DctM subunit
MDRKARGSELVSSEVHPEAAPLPGGHSDDGVEVTAPASAFKKRLASAERAFDGALQTLVVLSLFAELAIVVADFVGRDVFGHALLWDEEVSVLPLSVLTFVGAALAYARGKSLSVKIITARVPAVAAVAPVVQDVTTLVFAVVLGVASVPYLQSVWSTTTPILGLRTTYLACPIELGMVAFVVYAVLRLAVRTWSELARGIVALVAILVVLAIAWGISVAAGVGPVPVDSVLLFCALLAFGSPIAVAFTLASTAYLALSNHAGRLFETVPTTMQGAVTTTILLAIPFFILAGYLLSDGGLSRGLVRFADDCVGRVRGGLMHVVTVSMFLFSGLSGSKLADVSAVGTAVEREYAERGESREQLASVLAVTAIMGETVPPSTSIIILGSITALSIGSLFIGGILPAVVLGLLIVTVTHFSSQKLRDRTIPKVGMWARAQHLIAAVPAFAVIGIIVGGITSGNVTPTESSALAVALGLLIVLLSRRRAIVRTPAVVGRDLWGMAVSVAVLVGTVQLIVAGASVTSYALQIGNATTEFELWLGGIHSQYLFLALMVVALPIVGSILEGLPALLVLGPPLLSVATSLGVNGTQFGIVLIIGLGFGTFLPPIGVGYLFTCEVVDAEPRAVSRKMIPYLAAIFVGLVAVAYIPQVTLIL